MSDAEAMRMIKAKNDVCYMGMIIKSCGDCGADISHGRRVMVKTVKEVLGG
jgi:hypothetical protein